MSYPRDTEPIRTNNEVEINAGAFDMIALRGLYNGVVAAKTSVGDFELWRQAGANMGYEVTLLNTAGEKFTTKRGFTSVVDEGCVRASIAKPADRVDHSPFWGEVERLRAEIAAQEEQKVDRARDFHV